MLSLPVSTLQNFQRLRGCSGIRNYTAPGIIFFKFDEWHRRLSKKTRRDKVIGSSLEAKVVLKATEPQSALLKQYLDELPALFIVSCVEVETIATIGERDQERSHASLGLVIHVEKAEGVKCDRCWNIRNDVGSKADHPTLCSPMCRGSCVNETIWRLWRTRSCGIGHRCGRSGNQSVHRWVNAFARIHLGYPRVF